MDARRHNMILFVILSYTYFLLYDRYLYQKNSDIYSLPIP